MFKKDQVNKNLKEYKRQVNISAFIPVYNEEKNVLQVINNLDKVLKQIANKYEIIVVDDGSNDKTGQIVENISNKNNKIRLIKHKKNQGYGQALISGFKAANLDWVFFMDGDNQFNPQEIKKFLPFLNKYKVIIGYRQKRKDNLLRSFNAWAWKRLVSFLFPCLKSIKDIDCGFKMLKRDVINQINLKSKGAMVSAELLIKIKKKKYPIKQIGIKHQSRKKGKQTGANLKVILKSFKELFKIYKEIKG